MTTCIAITKKGTRCRNAKSKDVDDDDSNLFCTLHTKKNPDTVILEGTNRIIPFIDITQYLADVNTFNLANLAIAARQQQLQQQPILEIAAAAPAPPPAKSRAHPIKPTKNKINTQPEKTIKTEPQSNDESLDARVSNLALDFSTCTVCGDTYPDPEQNNLITCSSSGWEFNHLVCSECLKGHVSSLLSDGIASLECMFNKHEHCHGEYAEHQIKLALESNNHAGIGAAAKEILAIEGPSYSKWQEVMAASEIIKLAGICDNYLICPLCCSWGCIFEIPVGAEKHPFYIKCAKCARSWCTLCKRGAHDARSCYELAFSADELANVDGMGRVIDKMIQDIATRALTHCCSICGCSYVKEEGCNLMTCPKCNGMSCFICGMKLYVKGDTKYWHFTGHDKADRDARCPLWNNHAGDGQEKQGNTAFNLASIEKEFWNFISSNCANDRVARLICQRITANYQKDKAFANILKNIKKIVD